MAATVNYATERAYVTSTGGRDLAELITAVEAAGYTAAVPRPAGAGSVLAALAQLGAKTVAVLRDGTERRVSAETLVPGDCFVVRPGEKIATDGLVVEGCSAVDAALLTGESVPAEVGPGDEVTGATVNRSIQSGRRSPGMRPGWGRCRR